MRFYRVWYCVFISILIMGCQSNPNPKPISEKKPKEEIGLTEVLDQDDNTDRLGWQKPEEVIGLLGNIEGKTIADIGPGTGYFAFRFVFQGAHVIAADIDPNMIRLIETFKLTLPKDIQERLTTRRADYDDPNLNPNEVDIIAIINVMHAIENREQYIQNLKVPLKPGGTIMIIDWKMKRLGVEAPKMDERVPMFSIEEDLLKAGFKEIYTEDTMLDYQYVIMAKNEK